MVLQYQDIFFRIFEEVGQKSAALSKLFVLHSGDFEHARFVEARNALLSTSIVGFSASASYSGACSVFSFVSMFSVVYKVGFFASVQTTRISS